MRKKLVAWVSALAIWLGIGSGVQAWTNPYQYYDWSNYGVADGRVLGEATGDYREYGEHDYFLGFVENWDPSDPLYFLKRWEEGVVLALTFDPVKREEIRWEMAGERVAELEALAAEGRAEAVARLAGVYERMAEMVAERLERLEEQGREVGGLRDEAEIEAAKHTLVLEQLALGLLGAAAGGIMTAIAASERVTDAVADVEGRPAVPQEVVGRLQALKAQGILSEEEVAKIIGAASRREAREEMRKYMEENLIPAADLRKMDEAARENFPEEYFAVVELRKLAELKELETQKPDEETLKRVQEFAQDYKPGETIPADLRRWWVPLVRLEELQNTFRPDLLPVDWLRNRPEEQQKYQELVERIKPTKQDAQHVEGLILRNPSLLNDPAYARIKALADKFGVHEEEQGGTSPSCASGSHWVTIPFMPGGGYCVPNYDFPAVEGEKETSESCPGGYHRLYPGSACYADDPERSGFVAPGSCPAGYSWVTERGSTTRGYCAPLNVTDGGGYPSPVEVPGYCLPGQMFRDGKCERYDPPPAEGCPKDSWWNGQSCVAMKQCEQGYYQDHTGECREGDEYICVEPPGGCGFNAYWDRTRCSCQATGPGPLPIGGTGSSRESQEAACRSGGGTCSWQGDSCNCQGYSYQTPPGAGSPWPTMPWPTGDSYQTSTYGTPSYGSPTGGGETTNCGSGYYWNGSYCAPLSGDEGTYGTPSYGTPSHDTPSYGTPEYQTPPQ